MKTKRRRHDPEFKARVALEALKGVKTIQQIAKDYEVHPVQVSDWKKAIQEGVAGVFERGGADRGEEDFERERDQLKAIIGDLTVKLEFMAKSPNSSAYEKGTRRAGGKNHPKLSVRAQCELLEVPRSSLDYRPVGESEEDRELMRLMDEIYLIDPCIGTRRLVKVLERDHGRKANRKRLRRLRREMGLETIWCRPRNTSAPDKAHRKYPYLLGEPGSEAARPGVVRGHHVCADVAGARVSVRGDGLVFAQGAGLAVVQHRWACALMRLRWRWGKAAVCRRCSTPTKTASSPAGNGPGSSPGWASPSAGMGRAAGWTTCSSNGSGAA
jgi:transposase-like protein